jgi:hypothetical protein
MLPCDTLVPLLSLALWLCCGGWFGFLPGTVVVLVWILAVLHGSGSVACCGLGCCLGGSLSRSGCSTPLRSLRLLHRPVRKYSGPCFGPASSEQQRSGTTHDSVLGMEGTHCMCSVVLWISKFPLLSLPIWQPSLTCSALNDELFVQVLYLWTGKTCVAALLLQRWCALVAVCCSDIGTLISAATEDC